MNQREENPFTRAGLVYPEDQQNDYFRFCQSDNQAPIDNAPFPRRVDMWFAAMALAARLGMPPAELKSRRTVPFIEGQIFDRDPWRIKALMLLALSVDESIEAVGDPSRMVTIANGLAAAGEPLLVEMLNRGQDRPIWNLATAIEELLS